ncbi:MAG: ribonuclease E inhibitor RraB [Salinibacterium sp.]|nr:ribonuclease E inhibitor RraB [Planctomycetota bacterium]MCB1280881.1 ribonuclease E inhibitor RraB [Salinibacterium sp.]
MILDRSCCSSRRGGARRCRARLRLQALDATTLARHPRPGEASLTLYHSETGARTIAPELGAEGFESVQVKRSAGGDDSYFCRATKSMNQEFVTVQALRKRLNTLAADVHGECDGRGTGVIE